MREFIARDLMSTEVVTTSPTALVIDAAKLMLEHQITALPVVDDEERLIGIVSEADLLRRVEIGTQHRPLHNQPFNLERAREHLKSHGRHVQDVMTIQVASVLTNTPLPEIAGLFELMRLKRLPVTDHGKVVGIISRTDILRLLVREGERSD